MSRYIAKRAKKKIRVVGLMSGTSAGRVDLDRALEILKSHHQLLRPAIAEALE